MKKKFFKVLIIFSFLFCISNTSASQCVKINNTGESMVMGKAYSDYYIREEWTKYEEGTTQKSNVTYSSRTEAIEQCKHRAGVKNGTEKCVGSDRKSVV